MKVVLLAGGYGTRLAEHTGVIPKPMVEIGGRPILWHIMKHYSYFGHTDFVVALGYKGEVIKDYFSNFHLRQSDISIDLASGEIIRLSDSTDEWNVTLIDTGQNTMTGGRVGRLRDLLEGETFMLTYGDGVANVDLSALLEMHNSNGCLATITAVHPKAHYGELELESKRVLSFHEKPEFKDSWINGGFMVFEPEVLELLSDDKVVLERQPMSLLAKRQELMAYRHQGFWQCMDTLRDVNYLNDLWKDGSRPWVVWR